MLLAASHWSMLFIILLMHASIGLAQGSGDAMDFDGGNDRIIISDAAALDIQEAITIECWFLLEGNGSTNDFPRVVSKGQTTNSNGAYGVFIKDISDPDDIGFRFIDAGGTTRDVRSQTVPNYNDGGWHHLAATYSNTEDLGELYVDGVLEQAVTFAGDIQIRSTSDDLTIGAGNPSRFFNGRIDDVRIWNEARTQQQIREFMCAKLTGSETGLVGYWNMDGAATGAGNVPDLTANGLDGTMTNMDAGDIVTSGAPIGDESIHSYPQDWGGNCLDFDGTTGFVDIGDVLIDGTGAVTVEAWIHPTAMPTNGAPSGHNANEGGIIHKNGASDDNIGLTVSTGGLAFYVDNGSNNTVRGAVPALNTWTHVAATYDGTNLIIYQNGVLDVSQASTGSGNFVNNTNSLRIGGGHVGGGLPFDFSGRIDEVRVWNYARTANEITNDMCRPMEGDEAGLTGYWRFNELTNATVAIDQISGNDGTLTSMDATTDWVTADQSCSYTGFDLYMQSAQGDSFRVSSVTGDPDGIHIYNVLATPNDVTGTTGLGDNANYFGVWKARGTAPTYTGTYYYDENDSWQGTSALLEPNLILFTRDDNQDTSWSDVSATLNVGANTLSASALSTEFIIGLSSGGVLPITLIDFQAILVNDEVALTWSTASELNNDYFVVEKTVDGEHWTTVLQKPGAGNSSRRIDYRDVDPAPFVGTSYYRLKQVDFDQQYSHSDIRTVNLSAAGQVSVYPNPTNGRVVLSSQFDLSTSLLVMNALGQNISDKVELHQLSSKELQLNLEGMPPGVYTIRIGSITHRLVKQ